jgi:hypothetical protein
MRLKAWQMLQAHQDVQWTAGMLKSAGISMGWPEGSMTVSRFNKMTKEEQTIVAMNAAGVMGSTPGDVYGNMVKLTKGGIFTGPGLSSQLRTGLLQLQATARQIESSEPFKLATQGRSKEEKQDFLQKQLNDRYSQYRTNPSDMNVRASNPYYEVAPNIVAQKLGQQFADSKIGKILQPQITGSTMPSTEDIVATLTKGAKDSTEAAQMISQYYKANMTVRNSVTDFQRLGLLPTNNYSYNYRTAGAMYGSNVGGTIDLTNPTQVAAMLAHQERANTIGKAGAGISGALSGGTP